MSTDPAAIHHVSDTALLVAGCRAVESADPDAFVHDPFAARLAGERGLAMFRALPHPEVMRFGIAIRSRFLDELLMSVLDTGIRNVISVGAGLDTRPWRLELPSGLRWIEVDFAGMLDYKESLMANEMLHCRRERLVADLNDAGQRRAIYAAAGSAPALMITEGLLMYLPAGTVDSLAADTPRETNITHWITDIITSSFSAVIGGGGSRVVQHVRAGDCLDGEQILQTVGRHGWVTAVHRSYIRDLGFAAARIARMMAGRPQPPSPPSFSPDDPAGVHVLERP